MAWAGDLGSILSLPMGEDDERKKKKHLLTSRSRSYCLCASVFAHSMCVWGRHPLHMRVMRRGLQ